MSAPAVKKPSTMERLAVAEAASDAINPLDYMLRVMRDAEADPLRRDRMAMAAAPFIHARPNDMKPGKKDEQADKAKQAATGRFAASEPPLKLVGRK